MAAGHHINARPLVRFLSFGRFHAIAGGIDRAAQNVAGAKPFVPSSRPTVRNRLGCDALTLPSRGSTGGDTAT